LLKKLRPSNQNYLFKRDYLISVQQIWTKFSMIFISKTKRLLLETFFVYEFYSSSPITGFLLAGYIGTTLYRYKNESPFVSLAKTQKRLDRFEYIFFILFALIQEWFKKKKNRKSCPENWKIREKLKVLFSVGTAGTIWLIFFFF
jgi:hypothetical protein